MDEHMRTLPRGEELRKALRDRGLATDGLPKNANYAPLETAMQGLLLDSLRDERDECALETQKALARFTGKLVRATWAVAFASGALIVASIVQVIVMLK
jgi:hypothetical protein